MSPLLRGLKTACYSSSQLWRINDDVAYILDNWKYITDDETNSQDVQEEEPEAVCMSTLIMKAQKRVKKTVEVRPLIVLRPKRIQKRSAVTKTPYTTEKKTKKNNGEQSSSQPNFDLGI